MAPNICILSLNRSLLSVKGRIVNVFGFGGNIVSVATTQPGILSVKIARDNM